MRKLLIAIGILVLLIPQFSYGAIVHVQSTLKDNSGNETSSSKVYTSAVTAGNTLIGVFDAFTNNATGTVITVSDTLNGAWTCTDTLLSAFSHSSALCYFPNTLSGTATVTMAISTAARPLEWVISEYSGINTATPLERSSVQLNAASTTQPTPATTTTNANDLLIASFASAASNNGSVSVGTSPDPWVVRQGGSGKGLIFADVIGTSTGAYNATFTLQFSQAGHGRISAFIPAGAAAAATRRRANRAITFNW